MIKTNLTTLKTEREPIPPFLNGIYGDALTDLSWTDPQLGVNGFGWWNEVDETPPFDSATHVLDGTETLTVDTLNKTVNVVRGIRAKTVEELAAERKALVPQSVTPLQGELAIEAAGMSVQYEAWKNDPARTFADRAFITRAQVWNRNDPLMIGAATALQMSEAQLDELFILAGGL